MVSLAILGFLAHLFRLLLKSWSSAPQYLWRALNFGRLCLSESKVVSSRRDAVRWGEEVHLTNIVQTVISLYLESAALKLIL